MLKDIAYYGFSSTKYLSGAPAVNKTKSCGALQDVRLAILQDCTRQGNVECGGCCCSGIIVLEPVGRKEQNRIAYVRRNYW